MSESAILHEIEQACMFYKIYTLPREPKRLYCSVWQMPDRDFHAGVIWRQNSGAMRIEKRFIRFGPPGLSDFSGWLFDNGKRIEIEAKSSAGHPTPDQVKYRDLAQATGVLYGLVRSYDECCKVLEGWGLKSIEAKV